MIFQRGRYNNQQPGDNSHDVYIDESTASLKKNHVTIKNMFQ